jgi:hypothetical protein
MLLRLECAHGGDLTDPVPLRLSLHHSSRFIGASVYSLRQQPLSTEQLHKLPHAFSMLSLSPRRSSSATARVPGKHQNERRR